MDDSLNLMSNDEDTDTTVGYQKGKLDVNIVSDNELTTEQLNRLHRFLNERIGDNNMDFTINRINENQLIYTNNNKYNFIVSLS